MQRSYLICRQFLLRWIHKSFVVTMKDLTGSTAQRIFQSCLNLALPERKAMSLAELKYNNHSQRLLQGGDGT